jgi:lipopolysaccharide export LptBFGC system permease protein LptF
MESSFIFYLVFSFVLVALIIFTMFFINQFKEIRGYFRWRHSIIYLLGSVLILIALSLSYFIYLHLSIPLAVGVFVVLNGTAVYLLRRASSIFRGDRRKRDT